MKMNEYESSQDYKLIGLAIGAAMVISLHCDRAVWASIPLKWKCDAAGCSNGRRPWLRAKYPWASLQYWATLNINDTSLHSDMSKLPQSQPGRAEMIFSLVRFEVSHFALRVVFSAQFCRKNSYPILSEEHKCRAIEKLNEHVEKQYLEHSDKGIPVDFVTAAATWLILMKLKLAVCKPRAGWNHAMPLSTNY